LQSRVFARLAGPEKGVRTNCPNLPNWLALRKVRERTAQISGVSQLPDTISGFGKPKNNQSVSDLRRHLQNLAPALKRLQRSLQKLAPAGKDKLLDYGKGSPSRQVV